jgi:hypothetical protein
LASSYQRLPATIAPILLMVFSPSDVGSPNAKTQSIESSGPAMKPSSEIV